MPLRPSKLHKLKGRSSDKQSETVLWEDAQPHRSTAPRSLWGVWKVGVPHCPGWEARLSLQHKCTCLGHPGALWLCTLRSGLEEARKDSQDRWRVQAGPVGCHTQRGTGHVRKHNRATLPRSQNSLKLLYQSKWKLWKWGCQNLNCSVGSLYASFGHKYHQATPPNDTSRRAECWDSNFKNWVLRFGTGAGLSFCKFKFKALFNCC